MFLEHPVHVVDHRVCMCVDTQSHWYRSLMLCCWVTCYRRVVSLFLIHPVVYKCGVYVLDNVYVDAVCMFVC